MVHWCGASCEMPGECPPAPPPPPPAVHNNVGVSVQEMLVKGGGVWHGNPTHRHDLNLVCRQ